MLEGFKQIAHAADSSAPVLIVGESGIGKSECALDLIDRGHRLVADDGHALPAARHGRGEPRWNRLAGRDAGRCLRARAGRGMSAAAAVARALPRVPQKRYACAIRPESIAFFSVCAMYGP